MQYKDCINIHAYLLIYVNIKLYKYKYVIIDSKIDDSDR